MTVAMLMKNTLNSFLLREGGVVGGAGAEGLAESRGEAREAT